MTEFHVPELATLAIDGDDEIVVATIAGEIDRSNSSTLLQSVTEVVKNSATGLVVDCTGLRYIDSAGVYVFFTLATRLAAHQQRLAVVATEGSHVRQVLTLSQLQQLATLTGTVDAAVAELRAPQ
jgi:anti-anti-sigma factor